MTDLPEAGPETPWSRLNGESRARLSHLPRALAILLENILAHEADIAPHVRLFDAWLEQEKYRAVIQKNGL